MNLEVEAYEGELRQLRAVHGAAKLYLPHRTTHNKTVLEDAIHERNRMAFPALAAVKEVKKKGS